MADDGDLSVLGDEEDEEDDLEDNIDDDDVLHEEAYMHHEAHADAIEDDTADVDDMDMETSS